jgi:2-dehydropantoate 2-reductase
VRFVIFGAGAIGGVVGARLFQAGADVILIARGAHHEAIASRGLTLETPAERVSLAISAVPDPAGIRWTDEDVVLLAVKGQDTLPALGELRAAVGAEIPLICLQNGVENERVAARLFSNVYGAVVMSPTAHLEPGIVQAYATAVTGAIDIGRYPSGVDDVCETVCAHLRQARFESDPRTDVMRYKHAKLLTNLANAVQAVCGLDDETAELSARALAEGRAVLEAAGVSYDAEYVGDVAGRWERWQVGRIGGQPRAGGSSWQSTIRKTGSIESDYLNGEIVLRGRQAGVPTPVNALLQRLAERTARERRQPGWMTAAQVLAQLPETQRR